MAYSKKFHGRSSLADMQDEREDLASDDDLKKEVQIRIDNHFFGAPGKRTTKKERKKMKRMEERKNREEDF